MKMRILQFRMMVKVVMIGLLLGVAGMMNGYAQSFTVNNLCFYVNGDGVSVTVWGHINGQYATGMLLIPETVVFDGRTYFVTTIGDYAFKDCTGFTGSLTLPNSVTTIGESAFYGCSGFRGILTLPNSLIEIGDFAFRGCIGFTGSLIFPNTLTTIGNWAFYDCYCFTGNLEFGNSVTTIGNGAFGYCSGFTGGLILPSSMITIGEFAFSECNHFTSVTIGNSVTSIENYAFSGCNNLSSMTVFAETPPILTIGYNGIISVFSNVDKSIPVYVPIGTISAYQAAPGWNEFTNYQEIPPLNTTQTIELSAGWNWLSTNVEITLDDLKTALMSAVPNTSVAIKSRMQNTAYNPSTNQWRGTLDSLDVAQMYMILVGTDCEITLTGMPINPTEHPVTIQNGVNWIAFPLSESMSVGDAFGEFVMDGDIIKSRMNNASYNNGQWRGSLNTLVPGQGYMYLSNATESRIFAYPSTK